jgi:hypothetical protein
MNLGRARVVLRVRPLVDALDLSLRVCAANQAELKRLALVLLLPAWIGCLALRYALHQSYWVVWPVAIVLQAILSGAFTVAIGRLLFEERAGLRAVLASFAKRLLPFLGALLLFRLPMAALIYVIVSAGRLGAAEIIANAIWLGPLGSLLLARRIFVPEVVLLEGGSAFSGRKRALQVIKRHFGQALGLVMWSAGALLACVGSAELIAQSVSRVVLQLGAPLGALLDDGGSPFALAGLFLAVPLIAAARFLVYINLRTRKEGWDIQLRFAALAAQRADSNRVPAVA